MDLLIARTVPGVPIWTNLMAILVASGLLTGLLARRQTPTVRTALIVFIVNNTVILVALWFSNLGYVDSGQAWVPFQANKLGMLTLALLAPELWVGLVCIATNAGAAIVQHMTFDAIERAHLAVGEPEATIIIGVFATALLLFRVRRDALQRDVARAQEEARAVERLAQTLLDLRDQSNTPLQTIAFAAALIRAEQPGAENALDLIDRALARMKELDEALKRYEGDSTWELTPRARA